MIELSRLFVEVIMKLINGKFTCRCYSMIVIEGNYLCVLFVCLYSSHKTVTPRSLNSHTVGLMSAY